MDPPLRPLATGLALSLLLLAAGLALCIGNYTPAVRSRAVVIPLPGQRQLIGRLYAPRGAAGPVPAVVLCHGVSAGKGAMAPLAVELARRGVAGLTFDFGGYGESYSRPDSDEGNLADARAAVAFLRTNPNRFDPERLAIAGHSMGGTAALALGVEDRRLRAAVVLGMSGPAGPAAPRNLLYGAGLYEEFHPLWEMQAAIRQAGGPEWPAEAPAGDMARGTARLLALSPSADHLIAPYDQALLRASATWMARALGAGGEDPLPVVPGYIAGLVATFAGGVLAMTHLLLLAGHRVLPRARPAYRRLVPVLLLMMMGLVWWLGTAGTDAPVRAVNLLLFFYAVQLAGGYALREPARFQPGIRLLGLYGATLLAVFSLALLVSKGGVLLAYPWLLAGFPAFVLHWPIAVTYSRFLQTRALLFPAYTLELQLSYLFLLLLLLELMRPGVTLAGLARAGSLALASLRRSFAFGEYPYGFAWRPGAVSRRSLALLAGLLLLLAGILYQRWQSELLSPEAAAAALRVVSQVILLPCLLALAVLRSRWFQALEARVANPHPPPSPAGEGPCQIPHPPPSPQMGEGPTRKG